MPPIHVPQSGRSRAAATRAMEREGEGAREATRRARVRRSTIFVATAWVSRWARRSARARASERPRATEDRGRSRGWSASAREGVGGCLLTRGRARARARGAAGPAARTGSVVARGAVARGAGRASLHGAHGGEHGAAKSWDARGVYRGRGVFIVCYCSRGVNDSQIDTKPIPKPVRETPGICQKDDSKA